MGLDLKTITVTICKFSMRSMCKYVKKYPIISGLMCLIFLIYLFNPSIIIFLIYASPLIVVTTLLYRFYLKPKKSKNVVDKEKKVEKFSISSTTGKPKSVESDRPVATKPTRSMSQRRNKDKFFVEADPTTAQEIKASISDFLMAAAAPTTNLDLLDKVGFKDERDKNDESSLEKEHQEEQSSLIESKDSLLDGETSNPSLETKSLTNNLSDFPLKSHNIRNWDKGTGAGEFGSSEEDEEVHEGENQVVEWNQDDQKNLMDLGISEIERNKRLESLIARRRLRKLFKMNIEKVMIDTNIKPGVPTTTNVSPVLISKNDPVHISHGLIDDQFPGSAPSILLPGKNPFDLPYDPQEEKLDLMADSFQQEFSITPHKEMFMCRHESFSLGNLFPVPGVRDGQMGDPRPSTQFGNTDEQKKPSLQNDPIARTMSVTDLVTDLLETKEPDQSPRKISGESAEGKESEFANKMTIDNMESIKEKYPKEEINKNEISIEGSEISPNTRPPALPRPIPKAASASDLSNGASLSIIHHTRVDDHYPNKGSWHTPTNSIASDLQVEVSEVGSPPSTVDGTDTDDDKSLTYDGDVEKEINSGSEELWGLSPHAPRIGKHELALRFLDEASEEGMRKTGLSSSVEESISATTSPIPLERTIRSQVTSKDFDEETKSDIKQVEKEAGSEHLINDNFGPSRKVTDDIIPLRNSEETLDSLHDPTKVETMKNYDTSEAVVIDKQEELRSIEKQTIYEIKQDQLKPCEELGFEFDSGIEREILQGPEKVADVIVKKIEQTDGSRSKKDLIGTTDQLHHAEVEEKLAKLDPSINNKNVVSTGVKETSSSLEEIEDSRENIKSETIQEILSPSESKWKGPMKVEKEHTDTLEVGAKKVDSSSPSKFALSVQPKASIKEDIIDSGFVTIPSNENVVEAVKNLREDIESGNIEQILESSETQLTNSTKDDEEQSDRVGDGATGSSMSTTLLPMQLEVVMDDDLNNPSLFLSPVSVLADMNQATQLSPSPISEQRHNMDSSLFLSDQNTMSHSSRNEQPLLETSTTFSTIEQPHCSTSTNEAHINNLEMGSINGLVKANDQRHDKMDPQYQQWNKDYKGDMEPIISFENMCSSDSGTINGTYHMKEVSKTSGDDNCSPISSAHVEVEIENTTKSEDNQSHTTSDEKVDKTISRDLLEENKIGHNVTSERNEGESLFSINQEAIEEPSNPNYMVPYKLISSLEQKSIMDNPSIDDLISSTSITSESLSSNKQEASGEPLRESSLIYSTNIGDEIIETMRNEVANKPLSPTDPISSNTFEDESSSSIEQEAISDLLKGANLVSSNDLKASFVSVSQDEVEEPLKSTECYSLEPKERGFISPLTEEAIVEPLEQANVISPYAFDGKSMQKISHKTISKPLELAELASSKPLERESLSSMQREAIGEPLKVVDFISSNVLASEPTSSIDEEVTKKSLKLADSTSEEPLRQEALVELPKPMESKAIGSESLSSIMQGATEESSQLDYLISSNTREGGSLSSTKEDTILEEQKPIGSSSFTTLKSDPLLSTQQEAAAEPHTWTPIEFHDEISLYAIKEEAITQQQKPTYSNSSMEKIHATTSLQSELLHVDPSKSIVETKNSGVDKKVSDEKNMTVKIGIEHDIYDPLDSPLKMPTYKADIDHHHHQNLNSSPAYDIDNNQSSMENADKDQTTNIQYEISAQPTGKDDVERKGETQNKGNTLLVPSQSQPGGSAPT